VPLLRYPTALQEFSWVLGRAGALEGLNIWHKFNNIPDFQCHTCAPEIPVFEWEKVWPRRPGPTTSMIVKPRENLEQAMKYEEAMRARPSPLNATMHCHQGHALLEVRLNVVTVIHQLLAKIIADQKLPRSLMSSSWRLAKAGDVVRSAKLLPQKPLSNNADALWLTPGATNPDHAESQTPFAPKLKRDKLWSPQRKALSWMLEQERNPPEWREREREEIDVPAFGWRLEVEVGLQQEIRGELALVKQLRL